MYFKHLNIELPKVTTETIDRKRYYVTPEDNKYPSITTVLSIRKKEGLMEWRKRVGNDVANYVARTSAARGTKIHHMCEDYLNNVESDWPEKWEKHTKQFLPFCLFKQLRTEALDNIDNIHAQECGLYSDKYKVAGRVDCIAEYKGVLSIIDFKTSTKERNDEWNENYYIQGSAYAEMYGELTGTEINQVVILVVTEDGTVQEFIKDKNEYLPLLGEAIDKWNEENEKVDESPAVIGAPV
jgi:genome maintenance exonuclease 1